MFSCTLWARRASVFIHSPGGDSRKLASQASGAVKHSATDKRAGDCRAGRWVSSQNEQAHTATPASLGETQDQPGTGHLSTESWT